MVCGKAVVPCKSDHFVGAATGAACLAYAAGYEVRAYRLRRVTVPVFQPGQRPLRVLHISDLHMTPPQKGKQEWVRRLAALEPDLVIDTGDNLAHMDAVPSVLDALGPLLDKPGAFVTTCTITLVTSGNASIGIVRKE